MCIILDVRLLLVLSSARDSLLPSTQVCVCSGGGGGGGGHAGRRGACAHAVMLVGSRDRTYCLGYHKALGCLWLVAWYICTCIYEIDVYRCIAVCVCIYVYIMHLWLRLL